MEHVTYWVEGRMEYPGGKFSRWANCCGGSSMTLTGALVMIKRYREGHALMVRNPFMQYRIHAEVSK